MNSVLRPIIDAKDRAVATALLRAHLAEGIDALTWIPPTGARLKVERDAAAGRPNTPARTRVVPLDVWGRSGGRLVARGTSLGACTAAASVLQHWLEQRFELDDVVRALLDSFEELHLLWDLAERLRGAASFADVADLAVQRLFEVMPCQSLALYETDAGGFARIASAGAEVPARVRMDDVLVARAAKSAASVVQARAARASGSMLGKQVQWQVTLALLRGHETRYGLLVAIDRRDAKGVPREFSPTDRRLCETVASLVSTLHESLLRAAAQRELALARRVQQALIPPSVPTIAGFDLAFECAPRAAAGGDFIAFQQQRGGALSILTGDVAGHDVSAAVLMGAARAALLVAAGHGRKPAAVLRQGARCLHSDLVRAESFLSASVLRLDPADGSVTAASAGHPPLFAWSPGRFACIDVAGPILGADGRFPYVEHVVPLEPGAFLIAVSDGVLEAESVTGELFGEQGIRRVLDAAKPRSAAAALLAIGAGVARHGATVVDDRTILVVRRTTTHEISQVPPRPGR